MRAGSVRAAIHLAIGALLVWVGHQKTESPSWAYDALLVCGAVIVLRVLWAKLYGRRGKTAAGGKALLPAPASTSSPLLPGRLLDPTAANPASVAPMDTSAALRAWETAKPSDMWLAGAGIGGGVSAAQTLSPAQAQAQTQAPSEPSPAESGLFGAAAGLW